jgi:hypothetical protein
MRTDLLVDKTVVKYYEYLDNMRSKKYIHQDIIAVTSQSR